MGYDENGVVIYDTKNIEDIEVGDLVYSYNTLTGETELCAVTQTFELKSRHINYLTIINADGNEQVIESTDAHPFWVVTDEPDLSRAARNVVDENGVILYHENLEPGLNGFWVEAKDLRTGDIFLGANGELSTLTNVVRVEQNGGIAVFNFTVEGNHNYFILMKEYEYGQTCVLVHNGRCVTKMKPDPLATGPHTTIKRDANGNVAHYQEWIPNPKRPSGFDAGTRVDTQYANPHVHNGIPTPHVHFPDGGTISAPPSILPK